MIRKKRTELAVIGTRQITLGGQKVSYTLKRSPRARFARLEIRRESGLTVVVPKSYPVASLSAFLEAKSHWILSKLATCAEAPALSPESDLKTGDEIPYLGSSLQIVKRSHEANYTRVALEQDKLAVALGSGGVGLNAAVEWWYRKRAEWWIGDRAKQLGAQLGLVYNKITIRGQRSRWGSCSRTGNLSFNWKLIMAPEPVIDYVIIHELSHLKEMNHQKGFWELVARYCPRWREHKKWLKDHQAALCSKLTP